MPSPARPSLAAIRTSVAAAPAPWWVTGLGAAAALATGLGHFSAPVDAAVFSASTAVSTIITAIITKQSPAVIGGAAAVILGDFSIFGLHLSSDAIGALTGAITLALGFALHQPWAVPPVQPPAPPAGAPAPR